MKKIFILSTLLLLSSCTFPWTKEVPPPPPVPPEYETITITNSDMVSSMSSGSTTSSSTPLFSFVVQGGKFVIDKDLNNFDKNYNFMLYSKNLQDKSYIGFKMQNMMDIAFTYKTDIQRDMQSKIGYTEAPIQLGDCVVNNDGTQGGEMYVYITECSGQKYLIQLTNNVYEVKESNKKAVDYKAFPLTDKVKEYFFSTYYSLYNTEKSLNLSKITGDWKFTYEYIPTSSGAANGQLQQFEKSPNAKVTKTYYTKRGYIIKEDIILAYDLFMDNYENFDLKFPIIKDVQILNYFNWSETPGKYVDRLIFNYKVKLDEFIFSVSNSDNLVNLTSRYAGIFNIKLYNGGVPSVGKGMYTTFYNNFNYKPGFKEIILSPQIRVLLYPSAKKRYILYYFNEGEDFKNQFNYIYITIDNEFLQKHTKSYQEFIGLIK